MEVVGLVFGFIIAMQIVKLVGERIGSGRAPAASVDGELRRELDQVAAQLNESNERLRAMETRLDFYEKLIEDRSAPPALSPAEPKIIT